MKRLHTWWPVGFILAVWFLFASPYFLKGLVPFPSKYLVTFFPPWNAAYGMPVKNNAMPDVITQVYPWKKLTIETWKMGQVPLWNPYSFAGTPHLANYQSAVLSPFNLLFFVFSEIDAWSLLVLLQPLLAGIFMYMFLRELGRSDVGSTIGSMAFMFCGFIVVWMAYGTLGYAALWLPFILWAMHRNKGLLVSVGLALSFFSGHFQISIYVAALSLAYALFLGWKKYIVFWLAGILFAMPQILPAYEAYGNTVRSGSFAKGEIIPWQYLITLFAPDFYGNPVTRNDWFGHYAEWAGFIGVIPLVFAIYSIISKKTKQEIFFVAAALLSLLLALPTPLTSLLFALKLPALSTSAAARIIVITSFSLCVLASFGLDRLLSEWKKRDQKNIRFLSFLTVIFLLFAWGALLGFTILPVDKLVVAKRNFLLPSAFLMAAIFLFWSGLLFKGHLRKIALGFLLGLTAFDMLRFAGKWMPFDPREYVYPQMPAIEFLQKNGRKSRVFGNVGNELATTFGVPLLEGYDPLYPRRYGEFISALSNGSVGELARSVVAVDKHGKYTEDAFQLLGVRYVLHRISDARNIWAYPVWNYPHYTSVYKDEHFEVFENTKSYPRAFLASAYRRASSGSDILQALFDSATNRRETLVLEEEPEREPQEGEGVVEIVGYEPTRVTIRVHTAVPKLLFLSDAYHDGWKVFVDRSPAKLLRADYVFRAVSVPEGEHTVVFSYQPRSLRIGIVIATLVGFMFMLGSVRKILYDHRFS